MENENVTLGQSRVQKSFNPNANPVVEELKKMLDGIKDCTNF